MLVNLSTLSDVADSERFSELQDRVHVFPFRNRHEKCTWQLTSQNSRVTKDLDSLSIEAMIIRSIEQF